jgi:hypothetical protein
VIVAGCRNRAAKAGCASFGEICSTGPDDVATCTEIVVDGLPLSGQTAFASCVASSKSCEQAGRCVMEMISHSKARRAELVRRLVKRGAFDGAATTSR